MHPHLVGAGFLTEGDTDEAPLVSPPRRSHWVIDYEAFSIVSRAKKTPYIEKNELEWTLGTFASIRAHLREYNMKNDLWFAECVIRNPLRNLSRHVNIDMLVEYQDHPPNIFYYTTYWIVMIRLNVLENMLVYKKPTVLFYNHVKALQDSMRPLMDIFYKFFIKHQRFPLDCEVEAQIADEATRSQLFAYWQLYPDRNIRYNPVPDDRVKKYATLEHYERETPNSMVRTGLELLGWSNEHRVNGLHEDFWKATKYLWDTFGSKSKEIRETFKHFRLEKYLPDFDFDPAHHHVAFAIEWRVNECYDLIHQIMMHGMVVDFAVSNPNALSTTHKLDPTNGDAYLGPRLDGVPLPTSEAGRRKCVPTCATEITELCMSTDPFNGVPFPPRITDDIQYAPEEIKTLRTNVSNYLILVNAPEKDRISKLVKLTNPLAQKFLNPDVGIEQWIDELLGVCGGNTALTLFARELAVRDLCAALFSVDRFLESVKFDQTTSHLSNHLHRWRTVPHAGTREKFTYQLKLIACSMIDLIRAMKNLGVSTDNELRMDDTTEGYAVPIIISNWPGPFAAYSFESMLDVSQILTFGGLWEKSSRSFLKFYEEFHNCFKPIVYEKSDKLKEEPTVTTQTIAFYQWLGMARMITMTGMYPHCNMVVPFHRILDEAHRFYVCSPLQVAEWSSAYPDLSRYAIQENIIAFFPRLPSVALGLSIHMKHFKGWLPKVLTAMDDIRRIYSLSMRDKPETYEKMKDIISSIVCMKPKRPPRADGKPPKRTKPMQRTREPVLQSTIETVQNAFSSHRSINVDTTSNINNYRQVGSHWKVESMTAADNVYGWMSNILRQHTPVRQRNMPRFPNQQDFAEHIWTSFLERTKNRGIKIPGVDDLTKPSREVPKFVSKDKLKKINEKIFSLGINEDFDMYWLTNVGVAYETCAKFKDMEDQCRKTPDAHITQKLFSFPPEELFILYAAMDYLFQRREIYHVKFADVEFASQQRWVFASTLKKHPDDLAEADGLCNFSLPKRMQHTNAFLDGSGGADIRQRFDTNTPEVGNAGMLKRMQQSLKSPLISMSVIGSMVCTNVRMKLAPGAKRVEDKRNGHGSSGCIEKLDRGIEKQEIMELYAKTHVPQPFVPSAPAILGIGQAPLPISLPDKHALQVALRQVKKERQVQRRVNLQQMGQSVNMDEEPSKRRYGMPIPALAELSPTYYQDNKKMSSAMIFTCCGNLGENQSKVHRNFPKSQVWCGFCSNTANMIVLLPPCFRCNTPVVDRKPHLKLYSFNEGRYKNVYVCAQCTTFFWRWKKLNDFGNYDLLEAVMNETSVTPYLDRHLYYANGSNYQNPLFKLHK
jgi:hypothetical protein